MPQGFMLLMLLAGSGWAGPAGDDLCRAAGLSSGCIGGHTPGGSPGGGERERPERPTCDWECQEARRKRRENALANMPRIYEVEELDPVAYRENKTLQDAVKGDDAEHAAILAGGVLMVGRTMINPWLGAALFVGVIVIPRLHLEQYVPVVTFNWPQITFAYKPPPPNGPNPQHFPGAEKGRAKTPVPGVPGKKRKRYDLPDGEFIEWDYKTGAWEKYDKRGKHQGEYSDETGEQIDPPDPTRRVEP